MSDLLKEEGNILAGGVHTVAATPTKLFPSNTGFRQLTIRLETNAATNVTFGNSKGQFMFLKADESWTFGPDAGTVRPENIYLMGTAADKVYWCGILV